MFPGLILIIFMCTAMYLVCVWAAEFKLKGDILALVILLIALCIAVPATITAERETENKEYDVYQMNAPNGIYYTDVNGHFVLGCGSIDSTLGEAYTVKYWDNGELRTVAYSALDASWEDAGVDYRIHIMGGEEPRYYTIKDISYNYYGGEECNRVDVYIIFPFEGEAIV